MSVPSQQDNKSINRLGQDILVTINSGTNSNGNAFSNSGSIIPAIKGMKYFRALSNQIAEISCSFAKTSYILQNDGTLFESKQIVIGYDDIWYEVCDYDINSMQIGLIWPNTITESISIVFQFVLGIPAELTYTA